MPMYGDELLDRSDEELVQLALERQTAFTEIIRRYEQKLKRYITRISGVSKEEAEDILQEVFIKVYTNLREFDTSLSFSSWMYRIAHNEVINQWRKTSSRPHGHNIDADDAVLASIAADIDIHADVDRSLLRETLTKALRTLDLKYAEVIVLKFFEDKSYEEIADILKKPPGTVATLLNRAKKQLRNALPTNHAYETEHI